MEGSAGNISTQNTTRSAYDDGTSQLEQNVSNQMATGFLGGEHSVLHRTLPTSAANVVGAQPNLGHDNQGLGQPLPFRQFSVAPDTGLAQAAQSVDFGAATAAPRGALLGQLAAALDQRFDQRRLSEADSWHVEMLRTESLFSQRNYEAAKRQSCTDSSADVEYLLAGGFGLPHMRRTSSATTSHALAAGGLLPGPPRPATITGAGGLPSLSGGQQIHLPSLNSGVGPALMLHQPHMIIGPSAPTSALTPSQHHRQDFAQQQQQQAQQLLPSQGGSAPSVRISVGRMRDSGLSETLGSGSGVGGVSRHDRWSEEGASVSVLSNTQASDMSLPLMRTGNNSLPSGQERPAGATTTLSAPLSAQEVANRQLQLDHTTLFETAFGCISPAVPRDPQSQELQSHGPRHTDSRIGPGTALASVDAAIAGVSVTGDRASPAIISAVTGPGPDRFQSTLGSVLLADAGGDISADVDDRHISASAFLEFAGEAGVFGSSVGGLGAARGVGGDSPRSPSHLSVLAMQLSRQQQQTQHSMLQQQQLRQLPRGSMDLQQAQPGSIFGAGAHQLPRSTSAATAVLQEVLPRLSGAGPHGAASGPQLSAGGYRGGGSGGGYASPSLLGVHGGGSGAGEASRSPVMASPRHVLQQQSTYVDHGSPLQHSTLLAQAQQQQLHNLQPLEQQLQSHEHLQSHTTSPSRVRVIGQQEPGPSSPYGLEGTLQQRQQQSSPFAAPPRTSSSQSLQGLQQRSHYQQQQVVSTPLMQHLQQQASAQQRRRVAGSGVPTATPIQLQQQKPHTQRAAAGQIPEPAGLEILQPQELESQRSTQLQKAEGTDISQAEGNSEQSPTGQSVPMQQQGQQPQQEGQQLGVARQLDAPAGAELLAGTAGRSAAVVAAMARASRLMKRRRTSPRPSPKAPPSLRQAEQGGAHGPGPGSNSQPSQPNTAGPPSRAPSAAIASPTRSLQRRNTSLSGVGGGPVREDISAAGGPTATATTISTRLFSESDGEEVQRRGHGGDEDEQDDDHGGRDSDSGDGGSDGIDSSPDTAAGDDLEIIEGKVGSSRRSRTAIGGTAAAGRVMGDRTVTRGRIAASLGTGRGGGESGAAAAAADSQTVIDPVTGLPRRRAMTQEERMVRNREAAAKSRARRHQYQQSLEQHIRELQQHSAELRRLLEAHAVPLPSHLREQQARLGDGLPPPPPRTSPPRSRKGIGGRPRKYPLNPDGSKPGRKRRRTSTGTALTTAATPLPGCGAGGLAAEPSTITGSATERVRARTLQEAPGQPSEGDDAHCGEDDVRGEEHRSRTGGRSGRGRRGRGGRGRSRGGDGGGSRSIGRRKKLQTEDANIDEEEEEEAGSGPAGAGDAHAREGLNAERVEAAATSPYLSTDARCGNLDSSTVVGQVLLAATKVLSEKYQRKGLPQGVKPRGEAAMSGAPPPPPPSPPAIAASGAEVFKSPPPQQVFTMASFPRYQYTSPLATLMPSPQQQQQRQKQPSMVPGEAGRVEAQLDTLSPAGRDATTAAAATAADLSQSRFAPWPSWPPPMSAPIPAAAEVPLTSGVIPSAHQSLPAGVSDPRIAAGSRMAVADNPSVAAASAVVLRPLPLLPQEAQGPAVTQPPLDLGRPLATVGEGQLEGLGASGVGEMLRPLGSPGVTGSADGGSAGPSGGELGPFDMLNFGFGDLLGGFLGNQ
ncbi:hypothetical protein VaNZ11_007312 [Volvox africanus]|uniref:BZIP domain-containing protein n=1 Tax=Volvox africanus TaxID=51714 RepID=A0ABQ5S4F0_9CHLO|nr:hypothetical protein VaNZ11_007312 [Volvox africanus]